MENTHDKILEMLVDKDEVTWQTLIYELVRSDNMDPWNIDVSKLSQKYIQTLRTMKEHDFRISGKVLLAAAILLKIQSNQLVGEDLGELDRMLAGEQMTDEEFYDSLGSEEDKDQIVYEIPALMPRTPLPRKRKVSVYDLVKALQKALEVKKRRIIGRAPPDIVLPEKNKDIVLIIKDVYGRIVDYFTTSHSKTMTFSSLLTENAKREEKIHTFIPILHLTHQRKIDLIQKEPFGEIHITPLGLGEKFYSSREEELEKQNQEENKQLRKLRAQESRKNRKPKPKVPVQGTKLELTETKVLEQTFEEVKE